VLGLTQRFRALTKHNKRAQDGKTTSTSELNKPIRY